MAQWLRGRNNPYRNTAPFFETGQRQASMFTANARCERCQVYRHTRHRQAAEMRIMTQQPQQQSETQRPAPIPPPDGTNSGCGIMALAVIASIVLTLLFVVTCIGGFGLVMFNNTSVTTSNTASSGSMQVATRNEHGVALTITHPTQVAAGQSYNFEIEITNVRSDVITVDLINITGPGSMQPSSPMTVRISAVASGQSMDISFPPSGVQLGQQSNLTMTITSAGAPGPGSVTLDVAVGFVRANSTRRYTVSHSELIHVTP